MDYSKRVWNDPQKSAMMKNGMRVMPNNKATHYIKLALLSILATCLISSGYANAAASKLAEKSSDIEIKIETSRPRISPGTGIGVTAEITNRADKTIYFDESYIQVSLPLELTPDPKYLYWSMVFPTEHHEGEAPGNKAIAIAPGESYKVFCTMEPPRVTSTQCPPCPPGTETSKEETPKKETFWNRIGNILFENSILKTIRNEMRFIFFVPGNYTIDITAKYWIYPNKPPNGPYHTTFASKALAVDAPQSVIIFGAMLGGLISYFLLPQARRQLVASQRSDESPSLVKTVAKEVIGVLGAILLSAIVTILLARISETQFLIKVTVADFWGAVAIGFVANYGGAEIINKIVKQYPDKSASQTSPAEQEKKNANKSGS